MRFGQIGRLVGLVVVVAVAVAWFVLFRPVALGGPASYLAVSGESMAPHLQSGDLVIVQAGAPYRVGDVVAFRVPAGDPVAGSLVIHRIVGGDGEHGFILQGDNKDRSDPWRPTAPEILGRSWIEVPGSGRLLLAVKSPIVLAALLGGSAGMWVFASGSGKPRSPRSSGDPIDPHWRRRAVRAADVLGDGHRGDRA